MYDDGYQDIVNIDYSAVCIEKMKALHQEARPRMTCERCNVSENVQDCISSRDTFGTQG